MNDLHKEAPRDRLLKLMIIAATEQALKAGKSLTEATDIAANKVKEDMLKAEFESYCSERDV